MNKDDLWLAYLQGWKDALKATRRETETNPLDEFKKHWSNHNDQQS